MTSALPVNAGPLTLLLIVPHPDDEVLGCGGTIARLADQGAEVHVAIVTRGTTPPFDQVMIERGRAEAREAHKLLGVASAHFVSELAPLVKGAEARGEFAPGTKPDQVVAMVVLLLRHLDKAPFYPHVDPILDLTKKRPAEVERISLELLDALQRAYGRPRRKRTKTRS